MIHISVITPVYNGGDFIEKSISSVLNQAGLIVEHIIVNDGSSDNTVDIVKKNMHRNLVFINSLKNKGQANARNSALAIAKGEYICFLDADDEFCNASVLIDWFTDAHSHSADVCKAQNEIIRNNIITQSYSFLEFHGKLFNGLNEFPEILNATSCWQFLYKRSFLLRHELKFLTNLKQREDRPFFFNALLNAESIFCSSLVSTRYLVRNNSTMRTIDLEQLQYFNVHLKNVVELLISHPIVLSERVIEYTIQYYISTFMSYWKNFIVSNWEQEIVKDYLKWMKSLVNLATFNSDGDLLDIVSNKQFSNTDLFLSFLLLKYENNENLLFYLNNKNLQLNTLLTLGNKCSSPNERLLFLDACSERVSITDGTAHPKLSEYNFIIHMGLPKTGSSSIQNFFEINRNALYEEHGIYFPIIGQEKGAGLRAHRTSGHAKLIESIINNREDVLKELQSELGELRIKPKNILISSENIVSHRYWNNGLSLKKIINALGGNCFGILFLRNQLDWYNSMYQEMVMSPGVKYSESFKNFYRVDWDHDYLDFNELGLKVSKEFNNNCSILNYDEHRGNLLEVFCDALDVCNIKKYQIPNTKSSNIAPSPLITYIINKTNKQNQNLKTELYLEVQNKLSDIADILPLKEGMVFYDEEDIEFITSKYRLSNIRLLSQFKIDFEMYDKIKFCKVLGNNIDHYVNDNFKLLEAVLSNSYIIEDDVELKIRNNEGTKLFSFMKKPSNIFKYLAYKTFRHKITEAFNLSYYIDLDYNFYINEYPDSLNVKGGIFWHLVENRNNKPNKHFEPIKYLDLNPDVRKAGIHPTMHYYMHGLKEGRIF